MQITKDLYLVLFRHFGKANDLSKLATPPDDVFDYYCQCIRHRDSKDRNLSKDILQLRWDHLSKDQQLVRLAKLLLCRNSSLNLTR